MLTMPHLQHKTGQGYIQDPKPIKKNKTQKALPSQSPFVISLELAAPLDVVDPEALVTVTRNMSM